MEFCAEKLSGVLGKVGIKNQDEYGKYGLKESEVGAFRERFGENALPEDKKVSLLVRFLRQFKNIMIIVLLISAVISVTMALTKGEKSDLIEGGIIFFIVIVNAIIGVVQEKKAENSLEMLKKKTATHTKVIRNGQTIIIESKDVVVGDQVVLKAGDFVPADMRLITAKNLKCDESSLTGESNAVYKNADAICSVGTPLSEQQNMCFSGSMVTFGNGTGVVTAVGKNTHIGKIAKILHKEIKEKSPLEKNIDKIGKVITIAVLAIVAIVFAVELIFSTRLSVLDAFLISIALAVAAIPESLPAVITIIMALGVEKLARQGAIVKKLGAVETLGCCNYICSDKTGTLTQNKMIVKHIYTSSHIFDEKDFDALRNQELINAIVLCNNAQKTDSGIVGDATETSLLNFCESKKIDVQAINKACPRVDELPFDSSSKFMSTTNVVSGCQIEFVKGAYDKLIERCDKIIENGKIRPITAQDLARIEEAHAELANNAERVIACIMSATEVEIFDKEVAQKTQNTSQNVKKVTKNSTNMIFLGLFGIFDPPRPQVKDSIKLCLKAGLRPIMITGDHPQTALAIAREIGVARHKSQVITGTEISKMTEKELKKKISQYSVFCRVTPEDKVKIVKAFKSLNGVVAMTGDGVNDAPSLKIADIGIAMGSGTDVTKSVADLVLTNDDFSTIVVAVKEGRTIYANIQKTLQFLISTNAVEVLGIFITALMIKDAVFLLPSQILFINLITDSLPAFALGLEPPEKDVMNLSPRDSKETIFSGEIGTAIIYQAFVQTFVVLVMFVVSINVWGNTTASTMVFLTICFMQIIHAINCKTQKSLLQINIFNNKLFNISFMALFALILAVGVIPPLQTAFNIVPLNLLQWLIVALASIMIIPAVEICKYFSKMLSKNHKNAEFVVTSSSFTTKPAQKPQNKNI